MKFLLSLVILTAVAAFTLHAQGTGTITGTVGHSESLAALQGTNVVIESTSLGATTDAAGRFELKNVPAGNQTVVVSFIGFRTEKIAIQVAAGQTTALETLLKPVALKIGREIVIIEKRDASSIVEKLLDENLSSTEEVLNSVAGLNMVKRGNTSFDPVIRSFKENRINMTIDGIKIFGACRGRMDPPTTYLEIEDVENIEIVKGPNSVSMGPNSMGGGVNLISKKPGRYDQLTLTGSSEVAYHSVADGKKGGIELGGGSNHYALRLNGTYQDFDSYESGNGKIANSGFNRISYNTALALYPGENKTIGLSFMGNIGEDVGYPVLPMDADEDIGRIAAISYTQNHLAPNWVALTTRVYFNRVDHVMSNRRRPNFSIMQAEVDSWTKTFGVNLANTFAFSDQILKAGFDFYRVDARATRTVSMTMTGMTNTFFDWPDVYAADLGIFAEYENFLTEQFSFAAGLRGDFSSSSANKAAADYLTFWNLESQPSTDDIALTGMLSLNYKFDEHVSSAVSVARGNRLPDFSEYYGYFAISRADNYDYIGNPDLNNESNWNFELASNLNTDRLTLGLTGYYSLIDDFITGRLLEGTAPRTTGAAGVRVYDNIGEAEVYGLEANGHGHLPYNLHLIGNAAWARGTNRVNDEPLFEIPPFEANVGIKYVNPVYKFWLQANGRFVAEQTRVSALAGEDATSGFKVFDVRAGFTRFRHVKIHAGIENILNRTYHEHLNRGNLLSPGRNIYIALQTSF